MNGRRKRIIMDGVLKFGHLTLVPSFEEDRAIGKLLNNP